MRYSLRQLQIFDAVARDLSYTRAAEALHLTQPAVYTQVRQLEDQVGHPLIERVGKRLFLTPAGEIVRKAAHEVLDDLARMDMELADLRGLAKGRLKLAVVSTAKYDMPGRIAGFLADHPGIDVALKVGNRQELIARFADNQDDLYVLGTPPEGMDAVAERFAENPLVVIAPADHPLAGRQGISAAEVARHPFVMREVGSGTRARAERYFAEAGVTPEVRLEIGANEAIKTAVMAGLGLAVLSRGNAALELDHGYLVTLDVAGFPLLRHWHVAYPRGKRLSVAAEAFLLALRPKAA